TTHSIAAFGYIFAGFRVHVVSYIATKRPKAPDILSREFCACPDPRKRPFRKPSRPPPPSCESSPPWLSSRSSLPPPLSTVPTSTATTRRTLPGAVTLPNPTKATWPKTIPSRRWRRVSSTPSPGVVVDDADQRRHWLIRFFVWLHQHLWRPFVSHLTRCALGLPRHALVQVSFQRLPALWLDIGYCQHPIVSCHPCCFCPGSFGAFFISGYGQRMISLYMTPTTPLVPPPPTSATPSSPSSWLGHKEKQPPSKSSQCFIC
ncbi:hypothetical protein B0H16DRAFT_693671, partial [Mycena metata]